MNTGPSASQIQGARRKKVQGPNTNSARLRVGIVRNSFLPLHDHWHINDLSMYTHMPKNQKLTTSKNARACRCMVTRRTTSTTRVTRSTPARALSTPSRPPTYRSVHARDRLQIVPSLDVHEEAIAHAYPARTNVKQHLPVCPPLLSVPAKRSSVMICTQRSPRSTAPS